jgi:acyl-CoA dehydrogenase
MIEPVRSVPFREEHHIFSRTGATLRPARGRSAPRPLGTRRHRRPDLWRKAGAQGLLCPDLTEELGGPGGDFLHGVIVIEGMAREGFSGPGFFIHSEMVAPYLVHFGTPDQQRRWLPGMASCAVVGAIAMTDPPLAATCVACEPARRMWATDGCSGARSSSSRTDNSRTLWS